jgi:uncharacterized membrane protein
MRMICASVTMVAKCLIPLRAVYPRPTLMTTPHIPSLRDTTARPAFAPLAHGVAIGGMRLDAIDILRGLVMIIMMVDHTRDFVHSGAFRFDPSDVTQTTVPLFFTRWITHFCAPIFVFLAGVSIYLQKLRGKEGLSSFLLKRGLWLIVLEFTLIKVIMWFNVIPRYLATLQVIWVIGVGMILMAGLVRLPTWVSGALGIAMIALHNLTDGIQVARWNGPNDPVPSALAKLWTLLHQTPGLFPVAGFPSPVVFALYAIIPWTGVMMAGYAFGRIYELDPLKRCKLLIQVGAACLAGFVALRTVNLYGDPSRWSAQPRPGMSLVSFLNVTKYPPSLLFLLLTLGGGILALAAFEAWRSDSRLKSVLLTFGRVPLFYYILQWVWAHGSAVVLGLLAGKSVGYLFMNPPDIYINAPPDAGFSLGVTWLVWLVGVFALYPLCKWYAGVKARRKDWWISYT